MSLPAIAVSPIHKGIQGHRAPTLLLPTQVQPESVTSPLTCSHRFTLLMVIVVHSDRVGDRSEIADSPSVASRHGPFTTTAAELSLPFQLAPHPLGDSQLCPTPEAVHLTGEVFGKLG